MSLLDLRASTAGRPRFVDKRRSRLLDVGRKFKYRGTIVGHVPDDPRVVLHSSRLSSERIPSRNPFRRNTFRCPRGNSLRNPFSGILRSLDGRSGADGAPAGCGGQADEEDAPEEVPLPVLRRRVQQQRPAQGTRSHTHWSDSSFVSPDNK